MQFGAWSCEKGHFVKFETWHEGKLVPRLNSLAAAHLPGGAGLDLQEGHFVNCVARINKDARLHGVRGPETAQHCSAGSTGAAG